VSRGGGGKTSLSPSLRPWGSRCSATEPRKKREGESVAVGPAHVVGWGRGVDQSIEKKEWILLRFGSLLFAVIIGGSQRGFVGTEAHTRGKEGTGRTLSRSRMGREESKATAGFDSSGTRPQNKNRELPKLIETLQHDVGRREGKKKRRGTAPDPPRSSSSPTREENSRACSAQLGEKKGKD